LINEPLHTYDRWGGLEKECDLVMNHQQKTLYKTYNDYQGRRNIEEKLPRKTNFKHSTDDFQQQSILNILQNKLKIPWQLYLSIVTLRKFEEGQFEQIYVHSKLMIVDDKYTIIGSANINDRSMKGNTDSEVCIKYTDQDGNEKNGYAASLRKQLLNQFTKQPESNYPRPGFDFYEIGETEEWWTKAVCEAQKNALNFEELALLEASDKNSKLSNDDKVTSMMPANFITHFDVIDEMKAKNDQNAQDNHLLQLAAAKHLQAAQTASRNYGLGNKRNKQELTEEVEKSGVLMQYPINFMRDEWFDSTCKKTNIGKMVTEWVSPAAMRIETTCRAAGVHTYCKNINLGETLKLQIIEECKQFVETKRKRIAKRKRNPNFQFTRAQLNKHKNECTQKSTVNYCNDSVQCAAEKAKYFTAEEKERLDTCKNEFVAHLNSFVDPVRIKEYKTTFSSFKMVDGNQGEFSKGKCKDSKDNRCIKVKPYYEFMDKTAPIILKKLTTNEQC